MGCFDNNVFENNAWNLEHNNPRSIAILTDRFNDFENDLESNEWIWRKFCDY